MIRGRLLTSLTKPLTSHRRMKQIHGVIDRIQTHKNAVSDRIHDAVLPLKAVRTAERPNPDDERHEISKEKSRLHNLRAETMDAAFDTHDWALQARWRDEKLSTLQPGSHPGVISTGNHSESRGGPFRPDNRIMSVDQRQLTDCATLAVSARKNPEIANPRGAEDSSYFRGRFKIRQGDRTVSIHASGAVPGDSPKRANRHVSCIAVSGEPAHVQRGGKV